MRSGLNGEKCQGIMMPPYYVSETGEVFTFEIYSPTEIKLSNGVILQDNSYVSLFATEISARKYAALVKELGDARKAKEAHFTWVRQKGYETDGH